MNEQNINEWVGRAKAGETVITSGDTTVKVIRKEPPKNRGSIIMAVAEALRPHLNKLFEGKRDNEGLVIQPAHIRGYALNMAQYLVQKNEENNATA